jgi:hypothetical protein
MLIFPDQPTFTFMIYGYYCYYYIIIIIIIILQLGSTNE